MGQEESKAGGGKWLAIIAAIVALLLIAGAVIYFFVSDRDDSKNDEAQQPLHSDEGNYVVDPCAAQGDDLPRKLADGMAAAEENESQKFIGGMKVIAFIAHNQQVSEEFLLEIMNAPTNKWGDIQDFDVSDHKEMIAALDIDFEAESKALIHEIHECMEVDPNDVKSFLGETESFSGIDGTLVDDTLGDGDPQRPKAQTLLAVPADKPAEYDEALEAANTALETGTSLTTQSRVSLLFELLKDHSVDAAIYAVEHTEGEFGADEDLGESEKRQDRKMVIDSFDSRTKNGNSVPQIAHQAYYSY